MRPLFSRPVPSAVRAALLVLAALVGLYALIGFVVAPYLVAQYMLPALGARLGGQATAGKVHINPFLLRFEADDFRFAEPGGRPLATARRLAFDLAPNSLVRSEWVFPDARIEGLTLAASVERDGRLNLAALVERLRRASEARTERAPMRWTIERLELRDAAVAFSDRSGAQPVAYRFQITSASARSLANPANAPFRFDANLAVAPGGTMAVRLTLSPDLASGDGEVDARELPLAALGPLLARHAAVTVAAGTLSGTARVGYRRGANPLMRLAGPLRIDGLLVNEEDSGQRLLEWRSASTEEAVLTLEPARLEIGEVQVLEPGAKIEIAKDRTLNLARLARRPAGTTASAAQPGDSTFTAAISRVRVRDGTVDFADYSLALPFAARVRRLNGVAVGLSTDRASSAEVRLDGRIEGSGAARVEGGLNVFDPRAFTDLRVKFDNVAMAPLSPYTASFAGRRIDAGRLWLDLRYRVARSELVADNRIVIQDLVLGERVEAPNALDLPLDLAVAVLTDSQGRIRAAVPVRGNVDDPHFSYGRLVRQALARFLDRVVTAPFRALAQALGREAETLGSVSFEPGRARLLPPEREKLDQVAHALQQKPQLKVVVPRPYDARLDGRALRDRAVRRAIAESLGVKLAAREDPGPVAFGEAVTQRALEALLAERGGDGAAADVERAFAQRAGRAAERVHRFLGLFGKASPDREFYQAVFRRLVELEAVAEETLQELAARRADQIRAYLIDQAGADAARVELGTAQAAARTGEQAVSAELSLALG